MTESEGKLRVLLITFFPMLIATLFAGLSFTGSYEVGMSIYREFATAYPKPVVCEMGGKNPTIVSKKADVEKAAQGIARSAFGFSGQKCSACSRV